MTAQQLKNSILQMAVQGKLVPQDPNDEPASVLLERIRAEKEQLIKQKKIKREKNPSVIFKGADNTPYEKVGDKTLEFVIPYDIPETWEWVRFSAIAELQSGQDLAPDKYNASQQGIPYITGASNIEAGKVIINRWTENGRAFAYKGDLLITCKGTVGTMAVLLEEQVHIARQIMAIRPYCGIDLTYLQLVLDTLVAGLKAAAKSMIPGIAREDVLYSLIPIPPYAEQKRIVQRYTELMPHLSAYDAVERNLRQLNATFPEQLKKSILQEAVQGKLVPQDEEDESASILLERIRSEKEALIKSGKIKRDKHESIIFRRDNSHYEKRSSVVECIDDIIPFEIPDSWEWVRLETIITSTDAGKSPQCDNRPRKDDEWGVIKTTAIQDGYFNSEENKVLPHGFVVDDAIAVHDGDLLITRAGPRNRTGVVCVVEGEPANLILSDKTLRLSYVRGFVNPFFIMTALNSPAVQSFVIEAMSGMAASQVNISQEKMKTFLIPLPPLNEQQRIVDAVASLYEQISCLTF